MWHCNIDYIACRYHEMIAWDAIKTYKFAQLWIFEPGKKREILEWFRCLKEFLIRLEFLKWVESSNLNCSESHLHNLNTNLCSIFIFSCIESVQRLRFKLATKRSRKRLSRRSKKWLCCKLASKAMETPYETVWVCTIPSLCNNPTLPT